MRFTCRITKARILKYKLTAFDIFCSVSDWFVRSPKMFYGKTYENWGTATTTYMPLHQLGQFVRLKKSISKWASFGFSDVLTCHAWKECRLIGIEHLSKTSSIIYSVAGDKNLHFYMIISQWRVIQQQHTEKVLLCFHCNNGFTNQPQYYVIRALPILCLLCVVWVAACAACWSLV